MKKIIVLSSLFLFCLGGINALAQQESLVNQDVLRLHVIANSDSIEDQQLKLMVKDRVVKLIQAEFKELNNSEEAFLLAEKKISYIKTEAEKIVHQQGYTYPVDVYVGNYDFPVKSYGNIIFPAGNYPAVKIIIGDGKGKNWWCVLFPPLCLVSSSDKGLSLDSPQEAEVTFKCLELIPKGIRLKSAD